MAVAEVAVDEGRQTAALVALGVDPRIVGEEAFRTAGEAAFRTVVAADTTVVATIAADEAASAAATEVDGVEEPPVPGKRAGK